ncbi:MAG: GNAT family N-acetyltransferase [Actinobacteria bacterium]|nr:MAG: GNAT family N-acetyltransferase [Actinomycetota bacterium]
MSDIEIRPVTAEEWPDYLRAEHIPFGIQISDEEMKVQSQRYGAWNTLAAFEDGRIVATAGDWDMRLTLPGFTEVHAPGVTAVGVLPTHRRRGLLTALMRRQLDEYRGRGEAVATLLAAESVIYGRFGYGWATAHMAAEIDTAHARFVGRLEPGAGLELIDKNEAAKVLPQIFDETRRNQVGEVSRPGGWWTEFLRDPEWARDGDSELFHVVCRDGAAAGYASYRIKQHWDGALASSTARVIHLVATDAPTRARLWRYCLDVDLMARVSFENLPLDDPMRWMLRDPRRLRATIVADWLWVRPVDVARALEARRYRVAGRLVLEVVDAFLPENEGRYELDAGPDGAHCRRTNAAPDLRLSVAELGSAYLGGVSLASLAAAGRVEECTAGALGRADLMFGSDIPPWCSTDF